jgi:hypothetical protein
VLLLNASFEPLAVVTAKRAIVLMLSGKAECVQAALEGAAFHSENLTVPAPSVMRLSRYVRVPYRRAVPMAHRATCVLHYDCGGPRAMGTGHL